MILEALFKKLGADTRKYMWDKKKIYYLLNILLVCLLWRERRYFWLPRASFFLHCYLKIILSVSWIKYPPSASQRKVQRTWGAHCSVCWISQNPFILSRMFGHRCLGSKRAFLSLCREYTFDFLSRLGELAPEFSGGSKHRHLPIIHQPSLITDPDTEFSHWSMEKTGFLYVFSIPWPVSLQACSLLSQSLTILPSTLLL